MTDESYSYLGVEATTNYTRKYEYDPLGLVTGLNISTTNPTTGWFANVFTAVASEPLAAVSFWAASNNSLYTINVYTGVTGNPTNGNVGHDHRRHPAFGGLPHGGAS